MSVLYFIILPLILVIVHGIVMGKYTYENYDADRYLVYDDVAELYPRELINVLSGENVY